MSRRPSSKTKAARRMGEGEGASYIPYVKVPEFNSLGTVSVIRDWKTGRPVHCLSQAKAMWYYILRWDDNNIDIREQYPLKRERTSKIAESLHVRHPGNEEYLMTTDFLVTHTDGSLHAYSVKADKKLSERDLQKLCIEKLYWMQEGVPFQMLFKTDCNTVFADNIRLVTLFYDKSTVYDRYSLIKHLIATKQLDVNITNRKLDCSMLDDIVDHYLVKKQQEHEEVDIYGYQ